MASSSSYTTIGPERHLPYIWLLKSVPDNGAQEQDNYLNTLYAGAICVHEDGILVTVTHGIKPPCPVFTNFPNVYAMKYGDPSFTRVEWVHGISNPEFGISILKLRPRSPTKFQFCPFPNFSYVNQGDQISAYVNYNDFPFVLLNGVVNYPLPNEITIPRSSGDFVVNYSGYIQIRTMHNVAAEGHFSRDYDCIGTVYRRRTLLKQCLYNHFMNELKNSMPLIQVSGLGESTMDGIVGFPVFRNNDHNLVGLIALSTGLSQYLIPIKIVGEVFNRNVHLL